MKVLHVCSYYITSKLYKNLIESLHREGIENVVYIPISDDKNIGKYKCRDNIINIYSKCFGKFDRLSFRFKNMKIYKDIINKINIDEIDITHAHSLFVNGYISYKLKRDFGKKYIVAVRNTDVNVFFSKIKHLRHIGEKILYSSEKIIFLSEKYRDEVIDKYISSKRKEEIREKSIVIPNGIDDFWLKNENIIERKIEKDNINLVFTGKLDKNKNIITIIDALKKLNSTGEYKAMLEIIGDGPEKENIYKYAEKNITGKYNMRGFLNKNEIMKIYRKSDIFIMPSRYETFGLVYVEALTQGLKLIYTKGQGFDGYFKDGSIGYSVVYNDSERIKNRIIDICNGKTDNIDVYKQKIIGDFDWENIAKRYKNIYIDEYEKA